MENYSIEPNQLFSLEPASEEQLQSASKWARFIGIMFIVFALLITLLGVFFLINFEAITGELMKVNGMSEEVMDMLEKGGKVVITAVMIISAVVLGINGIFLFNFGSNGLRYIANKQENLLNTSLDNLKKYLYLSLVLGVISAIVSMIATITFFSTGH